MRHVVFAALIILVGALFYFLVVDLELVWLEERILTTEEMEWGEWKTEYQTASMVVCGGAVGLALIWYFTALFYRRSDIWRKPNFRPIWFLLLIPLGLLILYARFRLPTVNEGGNLATWIFAIRGYLIYHVSTAMFSPVNKKYEVPFSRTVRRLW